MIMIERYRLVSDETDKNKFYVKSEEISICPLCSHSGLKVIGSRKRKALNNCSEKMIIVIRRLKCPNCERIHHELPNILVPYKRYTSECVEAIIDNKEAAISCEDSTIRRIKEWFKCLMVYIAGSLESIAVKMGIETEVKEKTVLQRIKSFVGEEPKWLSKVVRTLINTNNWVHTRSAFMT